MQGYFSMEEAQVKLAMAMDPNNEYSYEDFMKEYDGNMLPNNEITKINIDFINESENQDPDWQTSGSAGFDLRANLTQPITLGIGKRVLIPTGLYFDIPRHMELQIRSRSGLSLKNGVVVLNGVGTIDSDYTGEIGVILINHGENDFIIEHGDRIAQGVFNSVLNKEILDLVRVEKINKYTDRSNSGYGSTGVK
jgi:dUTP pyrophosphatase